MDNTAAIRHIKQDELPQLLELYICLHEADPELNPCDVNPIWIEICTSKNMHYLVVEVEGRLVASCVLVLIANLTRGARPYGIIENVMTHSGFRRKGYGTAILKKALEIAWEHQCYKVMLLTGSKKESTLRFYEQAGFKRGVKTGFIAKP
ncbi:GNAT family N-acetyltransferase [Paenibacillus sp. NPDC058177]|uniref:GNAT family N-acetyltransferase n=1 Tax=Paenibacillus sp. NPDC058177 TaxID=3346369 RepID=UPI0036DE67A5